MLKSLAFLNILLASTVLVACAPPTNHASGSRYEGPTLESVQRVHGFSIDQVTLKCSDPAQCPENQGVLVGYKNGPQGFEVQRCSATIIGPHTLLSAGHCVADFQGMDQIWFKTAEAPNRPSRLFHATAGTKVFTPGSDRYTTDYGTFNLDESAAGLRFSVPAKSVPNPLTQVKAIVVNGSTTHFDMTNLVLDVVSCDHKSVHDNRVTYDMNPDVFEVRNCKIYSGNSGGAVTLTDDLYSIVGVVASSDNAKSVEQMQIEELLQQMHVQIPKPPLDFAVISNVRCAALQDWPQQISNCTKMSLATLMNMNKTINQKTAASSFKTIFINWLKSPNSQISIGQVTLEALPFPAAMAGTPTSDPMPVFVPAPHCLSGQLKFPASTIVTLSEMPMDDDEPTQLTNVKMLVTITPAGQNIYNVRYTTAGPRISSVKSGTAPTKSADIDALTAGTDLLIPLCQGNEIQTMIDQMSQMNFSQN